MTDEARARISRRALAGPLFALALLAWRIAVRPWPDLWRDWLAWISLYALVLLALESRPKARKAFTAAVAALLLAIYLAGQAPQMARVLGCLR